MKPRYRQKLAEYREYVMEQWPLAVLDWSESAAASLHAYESRGTGVIAENNGYAIGKRWIDWQISFWTQELRNVSGGIPLLTRRELENEPLAQAIK